MRTCPNCHSSVADGAAFCANCGTRVMTQPVEREIARSQSCPNCHTSIPAGNAFCPHCGTRIAAQPPVPQQPVYQPVQPQAARGIAGQIHCPECGSNHLNPLVETEVKTATANRYGSLRMSNTHRNYWMCLNCGSKFRNIQNLEEEIAAETKNEKIFPWISIICAIIAVALLISAANDPVAAFMGAWVWGIFFVALSLSAVYCLFKTKKQVKDMQGELAYLKANCLY